MSKKKTCIYVDGFNLYFGILEHFKDTNTGRYLPCIGAKWLNLLELSRNVLNDTHEIVKINYFTADITGDLTRKRIQNKVRKQRLYKRALKTIPNLSIIDGKYKKKELCYIESTPPYIRHPYTSYEEKGTDVNIATWMLRDAFKESYDSYVLISNDTDLRAPLLVLKNEFAVNVGLICPGKVIAEALKDAVNFAKILRISKIKKSQFPENMSDSKGEFQKPADW